MVVTQVFLDYVDTMTRLPKLLDDVAAENDEVEAMPDAARSQEIETLSKQIPRLISLLPDILHRNRATDPRHVAALEEMTKDLLKLVERAQPLLLVSTIHHKYRTSYGSNPLDSPKFSNRRWVCWMARPKSTLSEELDMPDSCRASRHRAELFTIILSRLLLCWICYSFVMLHVSLSNPILPASSSFLN